MHCDHPGCQEPVADVPENTCLGCGCHCCDAHLYHGTWYGGDPAYLCFDCLAADAEPIQY